MLLTFAKFISKFLSVSLDFLPGNSKVYVVKLFPNRVKKSIIRFGRPRVVSWRSPCGTWNLRISPQDDFYQMWIIGDLDDWESETLKYWQKLCRNSAVVIDVGAYLGAFSLVAAKQGGATKIIAFEPNPHAFKAAKTNFKLNSLDSRIELLPFALGPVNSETKLQSPRDRPLSSSASLMGLENDGDWIAELNVSVRQLDSIIDFSGEDKVGAVKIDVEGFELGVLEGSNQLLKLHRPVVILECLDLESLIGVENYLSQFGYSSGVALDGIRLGDDYSKEGLSVLYARNYAFEVLKHE